MSPTSLLSRGAFVLALCCALVAAAGDDAPVALTLDAAAALAIQRQPQLDALDAEARAARERAVAAAQLPDPSLTFGVGDLTLEGRDRFTLRRESDTQINAGLRQEFPRATKRELRRARADGEAAILDAERLAGERLIARETGRVWIDVWKAEASRSIARKRLVEAERQAQGLEIAYGAGSAAQSELLAARIEAESLRDQIADFEQQSRHYRNQLARWIGEAAFDPLSLELPQETAPDVERLLAALSIHPHFLAEARRVGVAETDVGLAQQDYRPDVSLTVGYGHRPEFADYAQLQVEIPLPVFTARRQDRQLEAARAAHEAEARRLDDALREHRAEIRLNGDDWARLQTRLAFFDGQLAPQSQARSEAALAAYGAGSGSLREVLDARRATLDIDMRRLDLQADSARHQVELRYFAP